MGPFFEAEPIPDPDLTAEGVAAKYGITVEAAQRVLGNVLDNRKFRLCNNELYTVAVYTDADETTLNNFGCAMFHLSIRRNDREPIHDWRDLQEIKNLIVGPEHEAIEIFPAESRLVDTANQYHLWVFADPGIRIPLGFNVRLVDDSPMGRARNRAFKP